MVSKNKNPLTTLALVAFLTPCAVFAADPNPDSAPEAVVCEGETGEIRFSLGAEAFYGIATNDISGSDSYIGKIEGIDLCGANLRFGVEMPSLFGLDWLTPEVFALGGWGQGDEDVTHIAHYTSKGSIYARDDYTSSMWHVSAGVALNFEITENFLLSVSGRLGYCDSKFKLEEAMEMDFVEGSRTSANFSTTESDGGLIYGLGIGAHWRFMENHQVSIGVEYAGTTSQPEIASHSGRDLSEAEAVKLEKQEYVFFSVGYRFVF